MILSDDNIEKYDMYITFSGNYRSRLNKKTYIPLYCENCNQMFLGVDKKRRFCGNRCAAFNVDVIKKRKQTNIQRYGYEEPLSNLTVRNKSKKTKLERYGDENYVNVEKANNTKLERYGDKLGSVIDKMKQTKLERYGDENYVNTIKRDLTIKEKYGVSSYSQTDEFREKYKSVIKEKYGVDNYFKTDEFKETRLQQIKNIREDRYSNIVNVLLKDGYIISTTKDEYIEYGDPFIAICDKGHQQEYYLGNWTKGCRCGSCFGNISKIETELCDFLVDLGFDIKTNDRSMIKPYELDIVIPDKNIAIEFDGLFWHSESNGKDSKYHLMKTEQCLNKGMELIHVFENEWIYKQEIVKSILRMKLGIISNRIYGRNCEIRVVNTSDKKRFLTQNHIQGDCVSKWNVGLYYDDELITILTIGKSRFDNNFDFEILRFCNKINTSVIGSFSKLFKFFGNQYNGSIVTYSDRRYFDGSVYLKVGMKFDGYTKPNYWYTKHTNLFNRMRFQKHKLEGILSIFDPMLTERQNMKNNGYNRIWDCGNSKYSINI